MRPPRSLSRCTFYGRCLPAATRLEPRFSFSSSPSPRFSLSSSLCFSFSLSLCLVPFLRCVVSLVPPFSLFSSGAGARYAIPKIYGRFRNIFGRSHACCYIFTGWQFRLLSLIASASAFSLDENYSG